MKKNNIIHTLISIIFFIICINCVRLFYLIFLEIYPSNHTGVEVHYLGYLAMLISVFSAMAWFLSKRRIYFLNIVFALLVSIGFVYIDRNNILLYKSRWAERGMPDSPFCIDAPSATKCTTPGKVGQNKSLFLSGKLER